MDQISATDIFNLNICDLTRARLIDKRRHLLTLLNGDEFYPISSWPRDIQLLFWKNRLETLTLSSWWCYSWVMTVHLNSLLDSHISTLGYTKGEKRARRINFITKNLNSKSNIWFYYDIYQALEMLIYIYTRELCLLRTKITTSRILLTIQKFFNIHVR